MIPVGLLGGVLLLKLQGD
ncbi:cytochrome b6-f complex subunit PetM [Prochlorococcus marinus]